MLHPRIIHLRTCSCGRWALLSLKELTVLSILNTRLAEWRGLERWSYLYRQGSLRLPANSLWCNNGGDYRFIKDPNIRMGTAMFWISMLAQI